jgi:hypothetical protein
MTSRAEQLFHQIIAGEAESVKMIVDEHRPESHYLEFKGGRIQNDQKGTTQAWSEALSGFANTEGGVLIWGVRASRIPHPDDGSVMIDAAHALEHVDQPDGFCQFLRDRLLEATVPPVTGVEVVPVNDPGKPGEGFVVCLVPEGNDKPYQAALHPSKNYMQRIDDRFVVIQRSLLRTMFFPQSRAKLHVEIEPKAETSDSETTMIFTGYVGNSGTATARELWIVVKPSVGLRHENMFKFKVHPGAVPDGHAWEAFQSIHPGAIIPVFYYEKRLQEGEAMCSVDFEIQLHSQHQPAQDLTLNISVDDVTNRTRKKARAVIRET